MKKPKQKNKLILGLTGSFGSGKSTVAKIFTRYGAKVIDADKIAHQIVKPGSPVYKKIIYAFGKGVLGKNNRLDRAKLARSVFADKKLIRKLDRITHPKIIRLIKGEIKHTKSKVIILDAPLLIEAGLRNLVDKLIVVKIKRSKQLSRLIKKTRMRRNEILSRIKCQLPLGHKVRLADFVIDNSGDIKKTRKQVREIRRNLWKS